MSDFDLDKGLEEAMAKLDVERRKIGELGKVWEEGRTTVRAKDQSLSMTFDGRGELVELVFNASKYRTLAPAQLASTIVETLQRGRSESMEKMNNVMGAPDIPGMDIAGLVSGKVDPLEMLNAMIGPILGGFDGLGGGPAAGKANRKENEERANG
ncbi:MAG: hypothetical protein QOE93_2328 [Actinomycetota bacterium]|jgi:hypothetical protein|nr:hypothetical protein [Actinomycetota bacterium]